jgi:hypothetical protein
MPQNDEHPWVLANMARARAPLCGVAVAFLLATLSTVNAQEPYRGTSADQQACTDDVYRLCNQFIPDAEKISVCLIQNRRQLSPACRAVFSRGPDAGKRRPTDGNARP